MKTKKVDLHEKADRQNMKDADRHEKTDRHEEEIVEIHDKSQHLSPPSFSSAFPTDSRRRLRERQFRDRFDAVFVGRRETPIPHEPVEIVMSISPRA